MKMEKNSRGNLFAHLGIWGLYIVLYLWATLPSPAQIPREAFIAMIAGKLSNVPFIVIAVYLNLWILVPRFLLRKRNLLYLTFVPLFWGYAKVVHVLNIRFLISRVTALASWFNNLLSPEELSVGKGVMISSLSPRDLITDIFIALLLSTIVAVLIDRYKREKRSESLEREKLRSELQFLRSQIQPHFFMNTLNNLYGMILPLSEGAADLVMRLSELMRYMLYEANTAKVALSDEIAMVQNYIELEKIRLNDQVKVNFNVSATTDNLEIAPMLLIVFVENSFKHGAYEAIDEGWLEMFLSIQDNTLTFKVENSIAQSIKQDTHRSGIGLENVRKRLDLLYLGKYSLSVYPEQDSFLVVLNLELD